MTASHVAILTLGLVPLAAWGDDRFKELCLGSLPCIKNRGAAYLDREWPVSRKKHCLEGLCLLDTLAESQARWPRSPSVKRDAKGRCTPGPMSLLDVPRRDGAGMLAVFEVMIRMPFRNTCCGSCP